MSRLLFALALLVAVYGLTLASFDPWDIAIGVILAGAVLALFRDFLFAEADRRRVGRAGPSLPRQLVAFWPFVAATAWDITKGTWHVTLVVLHLHPLTHPGIVAIPIGQRTPLGVAVSALATTLSPGTFLVDVDWTARVFLIHVLDASDPDRVRADLQRFYERWQRHVFP